VISKAARFTRIGKIYRVFRLVRIIRLLKIANFRNKIVRDITEKLKIGVGIERLMFLLVSFLIFIHILACVW